VSAAKALSWARTSGSDWTCKVGPGMKVQGVRRYGLPSVNGTSKLSLRAALAFPGVIRSPNTPEFATAP